MKKLFVLTAILIQTQLSAQNLELAVDINTEGFSAFQFSSNPSSFASYNNILYFSADGAQTGQELYSFDGTDVALVADIYTGTSGLNYNNSNPVNLTAFNNKLYFVASHDGDSAYLYSYDGLTAPTIVTDLHMQSGLSSYVNIFEFNGKLHFTTYHSQTNIYSIWQYDGINSPSLLISETSLSAAYNYRAFTELNGNLYFYKSGSQISSSTLYVYDGVNAPTIAPNSSSVFSMSDKAIVYNGKIYYGAYENQGTSGRELWTYDGVNVPTLVSDINPGTGSSSPSRFIVFDNRLFFVANDGTNGQELWQYDGSTVSMTANIHPSGSSNPSDLVNYNNKLHFTANDGTTGLEIFEYDGSNAPAVSTEMMPGLEGGSISGLTEYQNKLFFSGNDGTVARELYQYNGTDIALVANIFEGSNGANPRFITKYKSRIYFSAYAEAEKGVELYSYDGSNVALVADIDTNHLGQFGSGSSSQPSSFFIYDDLLYFRANNGNGSRIWKYDALNAPEIDSLIPENAYNFTVFNNALYFTVNNSASGTELWQYNGTISSLVHDINPGVNSSNPSNFYVFDNSLIFRADDGISGPEMWQYDGTNVPSLVADINIGGNGSNVSAFKAYDGKLYFSAYADSLVGTELYVYDGTNPPSLEVDIHQGMGANGYAYSGYPTRINVLNNKLIFVAYDSLNEPELWEYDLINAPNKVVDYDPSSNSYQFASMTVINDVLYFWADEGTGIGSELYMYNGTGLPIMFNEVNVGVGNSRPQTPSNLTEFNGNIYLGANDGVIGYVWGAELYKIHIGVNSLIESDMASKISVYPNPTQGQLFIDANDEKIIKIDIIDLSGKNLQSYSHNDNVIDVSNLSKGVYMLKLKPQNPTTVNRFVKE